MTDSNIIKIVGVTGVMGSGKSFISSLFGEFGTIILNTDMIAKKVQMSNPKLKSILIKKFGSEYYLPDSPHLNTHYVRNLCFDDSKIARSNLKWLTKTVGKYVLEYFLNYKKTLEENNTVGYILIESAILFESGFDKYCDEIICVKSTNAAHAAINRDNITIEEWKIRMSTQLDDSKKHFDYIIYNDYTPGVRKQVEEIHNKINNITI